MKVILNSKDIRDIKKSKYIHGLEFNETSCTWIATSVNLPTDGEFSYDWHTHQEGSSASEAIYKMTEACVSYINKNSK